MPAGFHRQCLPPPAIDFAPLVSCLTRAQAAARLDRGAGLPDPRGPGVQAGAAAVVLPSNLHRGTPVLLHLPLRAHVVLRAQLVGVVARLGAL